MDFLCFTPIIQFYDRFDDDFEVEFYPISRPSAPAPLPPLPPLPTSHRPISRPLPPLPPLPRRNVKKEIPKLSS